MDYKFKDGDSVMIITERCKTGYISSRVPGNGTGTRYYYVQTDDGESGPHSEDELEAY